MTMEFKVSAWGHCMIEHCNMETRAASHRQKHTMHLTLQTLLLSLEMAF